MSDNYYDEGSEFGGFDNSHKRQETPQNAQKRAKKRKVRRIFNTFPYPVLVIIVYVLLGYYLDAWKWAIPLTLTIPLYYTAVNSNFRNFLYGAYPQLVLIAFFSLGLALGKWHPAWLLFLSVIPFYFIVDALFAHKFLGVYTVIITVAYVVFGVVFSVWHPTWLIFLTIPFAEWMVKVLNLNKNN